MAASGRGRSRTALALALQAWHGASAPTPAAAAAPPHWRPFLPPPARGLFTGRGGYRGGGGSGPVLYDPSSIRRYFLRRPHLVLWRAARILLALGSVRARIALRVGTVESRAVLLRLALTRLGPAFVKLGQAMSTRVDLFPPAVCRELALLQVGAALPPPTPGPRDLLRFLHCFYGGDPAWFPPFPDLR